MIVAAQRLRLLMAAAAQKAQKQLDALETCSCKNLKQVLAEHNVGCEGVIEKEELIRLARRALTDVIGANAEPESPDSADDPADGALHALQRCIHVLLAVN